MPAFDSSLVRAYGRGLQAKGIRIKEKADFYINIKGAGEAELKVTIENIHARIYKYHKNVFSTIFISLNLAT